MIREARIEDLKAIIKNVRIVVKWMCEQGIRQWDDNYPAEADYLEDIKNRELFVFEDEKQIIGACTISKRGHKEYHLINWSSNAPAWTIKRVAINPNYHGRGIGDQLMRHAEALAKRAGIFRLTTDTLGGNLHAQKLFKRRDFQLVDKKSERRGQIDFFYFEKMLSKEEE